MTTDAIDRGRDEFYAAKKAARDARRAFVQSADMGFVRAMRHAIRQYLEARIQGVSREDGCKGLEEELRAAWPKSVSKFRPACDNCEDTGWVEKTCWERQRCGREVCARNPERQHAYVEPCHCAAGDKKRTRVFTPDDAMAAVSRTAKKKTGWRQVGA